jgi:hypothetical protein
MLPSAELLVSELANNALFNAHGLITLRARLDDKLLVDIVDEGPENKGDRCDPGFEHDGAFGLDILANLSHRWGVHAGTNHVWVELELAGSPPAEADPR